MQDPPRSSPLSSLDSSDSQVSTSDGRIRLAYRRAAVSLDQAATDLVELSGLVSAKDRATLLAQASIARQSVTVLIAMRSRSTKSD